MNRPRRAFEYEINVRADTHAEVVESLREIASNIEENAKYGGVMGGPSAGWAVTPCGDGVKSHEQYIAELTAYLATRETEARP